MSNSYVICHDVTFSTMRGMCPSCVVSRSTSRLTLLQAIVLAR
ncbi:hypothetical protein HMPREF3190_00451 [Umbribacter vaginalis]|nr:hypothetical protein HMPREF3190_00451 [Coriobacteriales bacterium DNF00809]